MRRKVTNLDFINHFGPQGPRVPSVDAAQLLAMSSLCLQVGLHLAILNNRKRPLGGKAFKNFPWQHIPIPSNRSSV